MKIVLTGVETNNKGAELMLYAILQEIERKYPYAKVYIDPGSVVQGLDYVNSKVSLKYWPFEYYVRKLHLKGIFSRLNIPQDVLSDTYAVKADYLIDGSGFCFSDQCKLWGRTSEWWESLLRRQYEYGAKIVFLPQAFGPLEDLDVKNAIRAINKYANLIMPREKVSYEYLENSGLLDMQKVKIYTDFTSLVEGVFPNQYSHLRNGICIIPNMRMIEKGMISLENYISLLSNIVQVGKEEGHPVYLLNHEGKNDEQLAYMCKTRCGDSVEVVTNLDALAVKGLISSSYLTVTSRFHGLASALNSGVPSFSTSWSHKYEELYRDYGLESMVLPLDDNKKAAEIVKRMMDEKENLKIRTILEGSVPRIKRETEDMWNNIWSI